MSRWALRAALVDRGYTATTVASGEEAVALVEQLRPEAILLDLGMPGIGGLEACTRIRGHRSVRVDSGFLFSSASAATATTARA